MLWVASVIARYECIESGVPDITNEFNCGLASITHLPGVDVIVNEGVVHVITNGLDAGG